MRLVVLGVEDLALVAEVLAQLPVGEELLLDPERAGHEERAGSPRGRRAEVGLQDPLELEQRLVVEADVGEIRRSRCRPASRQYVDGVAREGGVALLPREPLFLRRGDDLAVAQQARGAVVIEGGDAEDVGWAHGPSLDPVDSGPGSAAGRGA